MTFELESPRASLGAPCMREDARRAPDYGNLWPIALAPLIPAIGIAVRGHPDPRARLGAPALAAGAILIFAHGFAVSASTDTK